DAAAATVTAIEHALTYRVPVVLAIPYDVATVDIGTIPEVPGPAEAAPLAPDSEFAQVSLDRLAEELSAAKRPLLLAGRGAWLAGATTELGELAAATGALTATTALGRNLFPESEFDLGVAGGFGAPAAMERIRQADVAVVCGAARDQFTMRFGAPFPASPPGRAGGPDRRAAAAPPPGVRPSPPRPTGPMRPEPHSPPTVASIRVRRQHASANCCRPIASSSPTADISSPGRTCSGSPTPRTGWRWSARPSNRSGS